MVTWPAAIPQAPLLASFDQRGLPNTVVTQMDVGPPKKRRRYTKELRVQSWSFIMTAAQRDTFDTFFWTTLGGGALPFDHVDPITNLTASYQFEGEPVEQQLSGTRYRIAMQVLKLP